MSYEARISHLREAHDMLNKEIDGIETLHPNDPTLVDLKKKKLWLKDEIHRLAKLDDAGKEFK